MDITLSQNAVDNVPAAPGASRPHFWHMLLQPVATLAALKQRPRFFLALLVAATYATAVNYWAVQCVGLRRILAGALQASATVDADTMLENGLRYRTQIIGMQAASTFVGTFITALVISLLLWLLVTVIGGEVSLKAVTAVVAHVFFLATFVKQTMLAAAVLLSRNLDAFNIKNPVATNAAFFFHGGPRWLGQLLFSLDAVVLVGVVLTFVGLHAVAVRLSRSAAALVVVVPWVIYVSAGAYLASMP